MEGSVLLSNGLKMPSIGMGCGAVKPEEVENVLRTALASGYRLFDCALLYGNEAYIGDAFEKIFSEGVYSRRDVFITTKLPMIGNHPERVERFLKKSLANLKLSYVDLYLIHFPVGFQYINDEELFPKKDGNLQLDPNADLVALWKSMETQVQAGRAKSIGVSNFSEIQIMKILRSATIPPVNLQVELHVYFQQAALRSFCKDNGIVVSAFAPLGSPGRKDLFKPNGVPDVLKDPIVSEIAKKYGKSTAQVMLRFLVDEEIIPLPKSSSPERIKANIDIFDFSLSIDEIHNLRALDQGEKGRSFDFLKIFVGLEFHSENPFNNGSSSSTLGAEQ